MNTGNFALVGGWHLTVVIDSDNHLNIYVSNDDESEILFAESEQDEGCNGEQLAISITTENIERKAAV